MCHYQTQYSHGVRFTVNVKLSLCRLWQHMAQSMLAQRMVAHCASGVWHDSECHHRGRHLLKGVFPTAARPHHCHLRLSSHCSAGWHSQVHVQDCRHPPVTGEDLNKAATRSCAVTTKPPVWPEMSSDQGGHYTWRKGFLGPPCLGVRGGVGGGGPKHAT